MHSLVSDSFVIPLENSDQDLIPQILKLIPEYLANHENQQILYVNFEKFFRETVSISKEAVIRHLTVKSYLKTLSNRSQKVILGSLIQFKTEIKTRLGTFVSRLQEESSIDIPYNLEQIKTLLPSSTS